MDTRPWMHLARPDAAGSARWVGKGACVPMKRER
jgi:hypothetical protein